MNSHHHFTDHFSADAIISDNYLHYESITCLALLISDYIASNAAKTNNENTQLLFTTRKLSYRKADCVMHPIYECLLKISPCFPWSRWMAFGLQRAKVLH